MNLKEKDDCQSLLQELEAQKEFFQLAQLATGTGIWQWHLDKDEVYWDEYCWTLLGQKPSQQPLSYQGWRNLIHPEDILHIEKEIHKQLQAGGQFVVEFRYLCKEGSWLWVEGRGQTVKSDSQGNPLFIVGTHTDIQDRKNIEMERNSTLRTLNSMLQCLPDLVFRFNREGRLLSVKEDENLIRPAQQIQGQEVTEFLSPELAGLTLNKIALTLNSQKLQTYEYSILIKGQKRHYEARMMPLDSDEVLVLARDITEQKLTQQQLLASKKRLEAIFEIAPVGITITDEQGHIIDCNLESERLLGVTKEEHLKRNYDGVDWTIYAENGERLKAKDYASVQALKENRSVIGQIMNIRKEGFSSWILVSATPLNLTGYGVLVAYANITELKKAENQLAEQSSELRRSNSELEHFAYVASHDLRQPLRMISSFIRLLKKHMEGRLDDEEKSMMGFVSEGAQRMDQMLVSLLEYSRVGRKGEPQQRVNSRAKAEEALLFLQPQIQETQASVVFREANWPDVYASPDEMTRLFQNLINNALKYQRRGIAPQVELSCKADGDNWRFCVSDQGIGINPSQFDRLFKIFQRLHTSEEYQGSGIGLAVCRKIVEHQGGKIWVESDGEDKGSRFLFTLPVQPPSELLG
jgi:PAS domain S-box-containing protein